jgi:hypothetical protein
MDSEHSPFLLSKQLFLISVVPLIGGCQFKLCWTRKNNTSAINDETILIPMLSRFLRNYVAEAQLMESMG